MNFIQMIPSILELQSFCLMLLFKFSIYWNRYPCLSYCQAIILVFTTSLQIIVYFCVCLEVCVGEELADRDFQWTSKKAGSRPQPTKDIEKKEETLFRRGFWTARHHGDEHLALSRFLGFQVPELRSDLQRAVKPPPARQAKHTTIIH